MRSPRPLLVSTMDIQGGAARAAYRLHAGLLKTGIPSRMLVQSRASTDPTVYGPGGSLRMLLGRLRPRIDALPLRFARREARTLFSVQWVPDSIARTVRRLDPDVVNLHWTCGGFMRPETPARLGRPVVWTLHDMWPFTGGCHYTGECTRFRDGCGSCPQLSGGSARDLSSWGLKRKRRAYRNLALTVVAPSRFMANRARDSAAFRDLRIEVIPYGLDTTLFKPVDARVARQVLNLPPSKRLVLFGAMDATSDRRKGFHLLESALRVVDRQVWGDRIELVVFGASRPADPSPLGFPTHYMGELRDELSLVLHYNAADVFVAPSTEDNLPNTVMEALACGTPVLGYNVGGLPDMVEHRRSGYLADDLAPEHLARGLVWLLEDEDRRARLGARGRERVERDFTLETQGRAYDELYRQVVADPRHLRAAAAAPTR